MGEDIQILIAKYIAGEANSDEAVEAEKWISELPENEAYYWETYNLWHLMLMGSDKELVNVNKAFTKILERKGYFSIIHKRRHRYRIVTAAAAAIIILVMAGYYLIKPNRLSENASLALQEVSVQANSKKRVLLPDSTIVWVNAESAIKWDNNFNVTNRNVYLEGEAYFDVAAGKKIPFIVKTARFTIRDIGTIFNIKSFSGSKTFETVVLEGQVSVQQNDAENRTTAQPILLKKNEVLKINNISKDSLVVNHTESQNTSGVEIKKIEKPDVYTAWKDDLLVFDGESFSDVAKKLETKFNITVEFDKAGLGDFKYSGSFSTQTELKSILDVIAETTPINYEIHGNNVIIKHK